MYKNGLNSLENGDNSVQLLTKKEIFGKSDGIELYLRNIDEHIEEIKGQNSMEIKNLLSHLKFQESDINEWREGKLGDTEKAMNGEYLVDMFLLMNAEKILTFESVEQVEQLYQGWQIERDKNLQSLLTNDNLKAISLWEQLRRGMVSGAAGEELSLRASKFLDRFASKGTEFRTDMMMIFSQYSLGEIIGKVLETEDFSGDRNDGFLKLQYLAGCYAQEDKFFIVTWDGGWGRQTSTFIKTLERSEEFKRLPNADIYLKKIDLILKTHRSYDEVEDLFDLYGDVTQDREEYLKDPVAYWKKLEAGKRMYYGEMEEHSGNQDLIERTKEKEFIHRKENRSARLYDEIKKFIGFELENLGVRGETSRERKVKENIWRIMPRDNIEFIVDGFIKDVEIRKKFEEVFPNYSVHILDDLRSSIIDYDHSDDGYQEIREWIYGGIWDRSGNDFRLFSGEVASYIEEEAGFGALNVRKEYLENVFGFEIEPIEKKDGDDGIFYFKDINFPDTMYGYDPMTGDIFIEDEILLQGDQISFLGGGKIINIGKINASYTQYLEGIDVEKVLDVGGSRDSNFDNMKKNMAERIHESMHYYPGPVEIARTREINEIIRVKNKIVGDMKYLLGVGDKENLSKEKDGPYYQLMLVTLNTINAVDVEKDQLLLFSTFLEKFKDIALQGGNVRVNGIQNPLLRFYAEKRLQYKDGLGENKIKDIDGISEWKEKDLPFGCIINSLIISDSIDEKILDLNNGSILEQNNDISSNHLFLKSYVETKYTQILDNNRVHNEAKDELSQFSHHVKTDYWFDRNSDLT